MLAWYLAEVRVVAAREAQQCRVDDHKALLGGIPRMCHAVKRRWDLLPQCRGN